MLYMCHFIYHIDFNPVQINNLTIFYPVQFVKIP